MQILAAPIAVALCGLTAAPLSAEASSRPADGVPSGRIAVLHEPGMPCRGIPSSPSLVAAVLGKTGAAVRLLSADELARPDVLDATAFDIVVLPSGEGYPIVARESLIGFLKGGGSLITMGGYALNDPMRRQDGHWQSETELRKARYEQATRKESSLLTHGDFEGSEGLSDAGRPRPGPSTRAKFHPEPGFALPRAPPPHVPPGPRDRVPCSGPGPLGLRQDGGPSPPPGP